MCTILRGRWSNAALMKVYFKPINFMSLYEGCFIFGSVPHILMVITVGACSIYSWRKGGDIMVAASFADLVLGLFTGYLERSRALAKVVQGTFLPEASRNRVFGTLSMVITIWLTRGIIPLVPLGIAYLLSPSLRAIVTIPVYYYYIWLFARTVALAITSNWKIYD